MKKKGIAGLLAAVVLLALWMQPVALAGTVYVYSESDLRDAIQAAGTTPTTIVLSVTHGGTAEIKLTSAVEIPEGSDITLDTAYIGIRSDKDDNFVFINHGTLRVMSSAEIDLGGIGERGIHNTSTGTLILEGSTVQSRYTPSIVNEGTLTVNGGTVGHSTNQSNAIQNQGGTVTLNGGTIYQPIQNEGGALTINCCMFAKEAAADELVMNDTETVVNFTHKWWDSLGQKEKSETLLCAGESEKVAEALKKKDVTDVLVEKGDVNLTGLPEGTTVGNQGDGEVWVSGPDGAQQLEKGESLETGDTIEDFTPPSPPAPTPTRPPFTEPDYYPDYDEEEDAGESQQKPEETETYYSVTCRTLNVRSGAGTNFNKIGTLSRGMLVSGEVENGWMKFDYNGQTGYCSADYLQTVNESSLEGLAVTCRTLNVRAGAGTNFDKIGTLSRGTEIKVLEVLSGWYKIEFNGGVGYVSAAYIA